MEKDNHALTINNQTNEYNATESTQTTKSDPGSSQSNNKSEKRKKLLAIIILPLLILIIVVFFLIQLFIRPINAPLLCQQQYKVCPDGEYAERSGPLCKFKKCKNRKQDLSKFNNSDWEIKQEENNSLLFLNKKEGYSFEASDTWFFTPHEVGFGFISPNYILYHKFMDINVVTHEGTSISLFANPTKSKSIDEFYNTKINDHSNINERPKEIKISGLRALEYESNNKSHISTWFFYNNKDYLLELSSSDNDKEGIDIYNQIIATFKTTNDDSWKNMVGLKTYNKYGITFNYPFETIVSNFSKNYSEFFDKELSSIRIYPNGYKNSDYLINIYFARNDGNLTPIELINKYNKWRIEPNDPYTEKVVNRVNSNISEVNYGEIKGIKTLIGYYEPPESIITTHGVYVYLIQYNSTNKNDKKLNEIQKKELIEFLSKIKFVE